MNPQWAVFQGDALELLRTLPSESIDSIVTDPPAGITFMGREWDHHKGGRDQWVAWLTEITRECLRVLKPGGHALFWALPKTSHWTATAVEDGGFELRDVITHHFGSGMPKSHCASKAIDKKLGTTSERQVFATYTASGNAGTSTKDKGGTYGVGVANSEPVELTRTLGGSPEARAWDGWGTGLKPSSEHWILARKPLSGTLADNLLRHGAGALNIDDCRVGTDWQEPDRPASWAASGHSAKPEAEKIAAPPGIGMQLHPGGRWPTNAVFTHSESCQVVGSRDVPANGSIGAHTPAAKKKKTVTAFGDFAARGAWQAHGNGDGTETVSVYDCAEDCPVRVLERQSGNLSPGNHPKIRAGMGYGSTSVGGEYAGRQTEGGTAARFFPRFEWSGEHDDPFLYSGKASTKEREAGCENVPPAESGRHNDHTTVKPVALMRWLVRLVTPPGGVCLDIFCGSGTTGVACVLEGFHFMGFEAESRFVDISRARIWYWAGRRAA